MKPGDTVWYWTRAKGEQGAHRQWGTLVYLGAKYAFVDLPGPRPIRRVTVNRDRLNLAVNPPVHMRGLTSN